MSPRSRPLLVFVISMQLLASGCTRPQPQATAPTVPIFDTPYQAILLDNGQVYYGKLEGLGTPFPIMRDVFYTRSELNPETKQSSLVLLKRGKEWHEPDHMVINIQHVLLIEPVSPNSKVASLITELTKR
jgi:hypothetical protein